MHIGHPADYRKPPLRLGCWLWIQRGRRAGLDERGTERFEALLTAQGRDLLDQIAAAAPGPDMALRTGAALRAQYPAQLVVDALAQHELRLRAQLKFDRASQMFFTRAGLEQASSEVVARHRALRLADKARLADLESEDPARPAARAGHRSGRRAPAGPWRATWMRCGGGSNCPARAGHPW